MHSSATTKLSYGKESKQKHEVSLNAKNLLLSPLHFTAQSKKGNVSTNSSRINKKPPVFSAATSVPRIVSSGTLKHPALKGSSKIDLLLFASKKIKFLETYQQ